MGVLPDAALPGAQFSLAPPCVPSRRSLAPPTAFKNSGLVFADVAKTSLPLFDKALAARASFIPDYIVPGRTKLIQEPTRANNDADKYLRGQRLYAEGNNAEILRVRAPRTARQPNADPKEAWSSCEQYDASQPYRFQRGQVLDLTGTSMRFRADLPSSAPPPIPAPTLHRHLPVGGPFPDETVQHGMRGGIGWARPGDKPFTACEEVPGWNTHTKTWRSNNYADLDLQPGHLFVVGRTSTFVRGGGGQHSEQARGRPHTAAAVRHEEVAGPSKGLGVPSRPGSAHVYGGPMGSVVRLPGTRDQGWEIRVGPRAVGPRWNKF